MNTKSIPVIKRSAPKFLLWITTILYYLLLLPFSYLMKLIGKPGALFNFMGRRAANSKKLEKAFKGYIPDAQDIFVSTFVKSGTNWMMQIAHQIAWHGEGEYENIHDAVAWPDTPNKGATKMMTPLNGDIIKQLSPSGIRVIKTHLSAHYVPINEHAKYLIVVRDPKEVFVSSYPFVRSLAGPIMPDVDVWLDMFLTKHWSMNFGNTWAEHTDSYWKLRNEPNVLLLSYSQLKRDPEAGIHQVAETIGVNLSEQEFTKVLEKSSVQYMKGINDKFNPMGKSSFPWGGDFKMVREGKTGNSSELISREQQIRIDNHFIQELKSLDSDFPYDEFCNITK